MSEGAGETQREPQIQLPSLGNATVPPPPIPTVVATPALPPPPPPTPGTPRPPVNRKPTPKPLTAAQWLLWSFLCVTATTLSASVGALLALLAPLPPALSPWEAKSTAPNTWTSGLQYQVSRPVNILVMGIDRVLGVPDASPEVFSGRSDTMLLIHVDPDTQSVSLLSVPRDTQVEIPTVGVTKINDANARGGPALAARVVSRTLNDVPIDRYVRVSTSAFRELVDLLGGIDVYVPEAMQYTDVTQKLKIDLPQGWQTLNGDQAEQFARFRHDAYGDIGRVQRQQSLLKSLRDRLTNPTVVTRVPQMIRVMQKYVDTNLSPEEFLALTNFALKLDQQHLKMVMLPGRFSTPDEYVASYWIMSPEGRDRVMKQYFNIEPFFSSSTTTPSRTAQDLQIAVQNASGEPDMGHKVAEFLKAQGFHKVYVVENWPDTLRETQVIVQQGDLDAANTLQKALQVGRVEMASTGDIESDLTVRVGQDWLKTP